MQALLTGLVAVVTSSGSPRLPAVYSATIEIHDGDRGWQPGWQRADYTKEIFSDARTAVDPTTGMNRTDESINANGTVFTVWRKWNKGHTEQGCQKCPTCTGRPLPREYLTGATLVKAGVDCTLGEKACDEWHGIYQGPRDEPVTVLVSAKDVEQLVRISWAASSSGDGLWIDYAHWKSGESDIKIPSNCDAARPAQM